MKKEISALALKSLIPAALVIVLVLSVNISVVRPLRAVSGRAVYQPPKILVDAGHGGVDGGAVSPIDGTVEKELNLSVALDLCDLFRLMGYGVTMTRTEDISIHDDGADTVRQQKTSDLKKRLKMLDEGDCELMISVHMNMFSVEKYNGTQVFYGGNNELSKVLAEDVQKSVKTLLQPTNERTVKKSTSSIYILYNAKKPAIMAECGFLSNNTELQKLKSEEYRLKLAIALLNGVNLYKFSENY